MLSVTNCARQRQAKQEQAKPTAHCDSGAPMRSGARLKNGPANSNALQYLEHTAYQKAYILERT